MKRKLFALALSGMMILSLLTACGSSGGSTAAAGNGEMRDDTQMESTAGGDMAPAAPQSVQVNFFSPVVMQPAAFTSTPASHL